MTPERFAHLADAYGADLRHWPAAEQEDARRLLASGETSVHETLRQAAWLDRQLDIHRAATPDPLLVRAVLAAAFTPASSSFWRRHWEWLSSLGIVGVGLAGAAAGMLVVSLSLPLTGTPEVLPSIFDHGDVELFQGLDAEENDQ
jgi:hypothetical protein